MLIPLEQKIEMILKRCSLCLQIYVGKKSSCLIFHKKKSCTKCWTYNSTTFDMNNFQNPLFTNNNNNQVSNSDHYLVIFACIDNNMDICLQLQANDLSCPVYLIKINQLTLSYHLQILYFLGTYSSPYSMHEYEDEQEPGEDNPQIASMSSSYAHFSLHEDSRHGYSPCSNMRY